MTAGEEGRKMGGEEARIEKWSPGEGGRAREGGTRGRSRVVFSNHTDGGGCSLAVMAAAIDLTKPQDMGQCLVAGDVDSVSSFVTRDDEDASLDISPDGWRY